LRLRTVNVPPPTVPMPRRPTLMGFMVFWGVKRSVLKVEKGRDNSRAPANAQVP
jgi:hypothetical protein